MKLRRELFLEQFDSSFRNHIVEFSKRITSLSKEYDVLIFLARKAACLADCFDELQLSHFHCIVTSSRILDMNLSWMHNKKVAIIDDTLISGTTIWVCGGFIFSGLRHISRTSSATSRHPEWEWHLSLHCMQ